MLTVHDAGGLTELHIESKAQTVDDLIAAIAQLLAGREAERLICGDVSAGAGGHENSDLAKATKLAVGVEASFGLGSLGPIWLGQPERLIATLPHTQLGGKISAILHHGGAEAQRALVENRGALEGLAKTLSDESYLDAAQIRTALGPVRKIAVRPLTTPSAKGSADGHKDTRPRNVTDDPSHTH